MFIYDAACAYREEGIPLLVLAGKDYGMGSSRDWAAKGTLLLGIRGVIAESYERIHRSNLIGMGVLPLQFLEGQSVAGLGLSGKEIFSIEKLSGYGQKLEVIAVNDNEEKRFQVLSRLDTEVELEYYLNGGILHTVLRNLAGETGDG